MQEIIDKNITYRRTECHTTEAVRIFNERGMTDKVKLLETSGSIYTYYYSLEDTIDYYYGNLLPSTGFIWLFDIVKYYDGLLLRIPNRLMYWKKSSSRKKCWMYLRNICVGIISWD